MAKAYLKIDVDPGKENDVRTALRAIAGVKSVDLTSGEQDLIALIEAGNPEELLNLVVSQLRTIPGIRKTTTNLILE